tara:strand:+ start:44 stop:415 length:372 start_codon:yes stop_codon:yes gene_type:complete
MKLSNKEIKNLLEMLLSDDEDNHYMAFQVIKQSDITDVHTLMALYVYGKPDKKEWSLNAFKHYCALTQYYDPEDLTRVNVIGHLAFIKDRKELLEVCFEYYIKNTINLAKTLGYKDLKVKLIK